METCLNVGQFEREIEKLTDAARVDNGFKGGVFFFIWKGFE